MKYNQAQPYRTPSLTPQSRSIRFALNSKGFTLIELLVVVSIISLISTIVFAALSDARVKARNTAKNNLVMEYIKALELYRSDNGGSYPLTAPKPLIGNAIPVCVGYINGESCFWNRLGSTNLRDTLQPYFSGDFAHRTSILISNNDYKGVIYTCPEENNLCTEYSLVWILEKQVTSCVSGSTPTLFNSHRRCTYPQTN